MKTRQPLCVLQISLCVALFGAFAGLIARLPTAPSYQISTYKTPASPSFQAHVIKVTDGDSITVRVGDQNTKIRLAQIDAPERGQPWGNRSRDELAALVAGKIVTVTPMGEDRYSRVIAQVSVGSVDINTAMIARGSAWAYRAYLRDQSLISVEAQARSAGVGLWAMPEAQRMPPWEYRAVQRRDSGVVIGR